MNMLKLVKSALDECSYFCPPPLSLLSLFWCQVFGRVTKGMDVVQMMEHAKCNHLDKPLDDIKILSIDISTA